MKEKLLHMRKNEVFFFSSRRRHTRYWRDWSSDVCSSDLACMLVGEHAFVMLLSREKFAEFSKLPIADPTPHTLALYCFSVSSREEVDAVSAAALAAGGSEADDAEDYGFMYSRSFFDLDGHGWQVMWMDPAAAEQGPEALAASVQDADTPA